MNLICLLCMRQDNDDGTAFRAIIIIDLVEQSSVGAAAAASKPAPYVRLPQTAYTTLWVSTRGPE
jgi:hypothetical protein